MRGFDDQSPESYWELARNWASTRSREKLQSIILKCGGSYIKKPCCITAWLI
jgi:hypothetical protein